MRLIKPSFTGENTKSLLKEQIVSCRGGKKNDSVKKINKTRKKKTKIKPLKNKAESVNVDDSIPNGSSEADMNLLMDADSYVQSGLPNNYFLQRVKDIWNRTPPITQLYLFISVAITSLSFLFNRNKWPRILSFNIRDVIGKMHFWKVFTGFFNLGQLDVFYLLTVQYVWQNMSQLEKLSFKNPEDFVVMLFFGMFSLLITYSLLNLPTVYLGHNLTSFLVYIWSRLFEGMDVNFMDLITLKAEHLPYFTVLQGLVLEGQLPITDIIGILVGYLFYYLKQKDLIHSPTWLKLILQRSSIHKSYEKFKEDFEM
jgi:Derlin-2/3